MSEKKKTNAPSPDPHKVYVEGLLDMSFLLAMQNISKIPKRLMDHLVNRQQYHSQKKEKKEKLTKH